MSAISTEKTVPKGGEIADTLLHKYTQVIW